MGYAISSTLMGRLLTDAKNSPEREVCGLLFGAEGRIEAAEACANVAAEPARAFEIEPGALIAAYRRARAGGPRVIGHYHSHPSGEPVPSERDAAQAMGDGALWLIVGAAEGRLWRSVEVGVFEAVGLELEG